MRTALLLLLLLAVAAVPGSVFPQRRINPGRVEEYLANHRGYGAWLDRLGFFDVYSSIWFSAVYLLLFVSLVGGVLPRARVHLRALRAAPPGTPRRLERLPAHTRVSVDTPVDDVLDALAATLRRRRYRVARHDGASVSAERGYLSETGNLVFHLALLALLVAVAVGSMVGYSGQVLVVEKTSFANSVASYDSFEAGPRVDRGNLAPLAFTLDDLRVRFEAQAGGTQFGAPREFDADLTVRDEPDAPPRRVTISPNNPLDSGGVRVFLLGNGYAPVLTVRDGQGNEAFSGPVPFLPTGQANYKSAGVVKVPFAKPRQIGLTGLFLPTYAIDPAEGPISRFPDVVAAPLPPHAAPGPARGPHLALPRRRPAAARPDSVRLQTGGRRDDDERGRLRLRPRHQPARAAEGLGRSAAAAAPRAGCDGHAPGWRRHCDLRRTAPLRRVRRPVRPDEAVGARRRGPRAGRSDRVAVRATSPGLVQREH